MGDFLRMVLDSIQFIWPLRIVQEWERGGYYLRGRWWREVGPGLYAVLPWFTEVRCISVVPAIVSTGRQDITLSDGTLLSFTASATVRVVNLNLAVNSVDSYTETTQELVSAVLADKLAEVDASRFTPEKRSRLLADLRRWVAPEAATFGVEITQLRFTTFVTNARTFRLMQDTPNVITW